MNSLRRERIETRGLTRRRLLCLGVLGLAGWMASPIRNVAAAVQNDLALVAAIPRKTPREAPLLVFRDFATDPDVEVIRHIRHELGQQKDMLARIRQTIGFEKRVKFSMEEIQVRLMYVPQLQDRHADAYYRYCLDVTEALFQMTGMDNFYDVITCPRTRFPAVSTTGKSAFLVHRLAKAYRAVCRFTAESGRSVKTTLSGAIFSNHLGAVDLEIQLMAPGEYRLTRRPFTIWQNDTRNLSTLMSIPVEETLHFYIGQATDREIANAMAHHPPTDLAAAQRLAQSWMAVEEAVVGGLVNSMLAGYCTRRHVTLPGFYTGETHPAVPSLHRYRYRDQGIRLVRDLGFKDAVSRYMDNPSAFRAQLLRRPDA
ncbi:hypothetical protein DSCA_43670 [Desulfosarcina alkanivorans]|uniref:Uncharacterized protein n=1 Tax=Desulfosarcina alkanivorans TaxID=571177 RepID=A0A5K7Z0V0_9BACT|nr:hypothetical protein [Desulfosarcina alkanivorans]BBO70437.1 hypothetical protein DSCA_43670 [Desulfosarcina alkanivorans]